MPQWFTKKPNDERRGPFSEGELRRQALSGDLARTDLIWCEGLEMAIPAASWPGLFPPPTPMPQPIAVPQPERPAPQSVQEQEEEEDVFSWYRPGDSRAPITVNAMPFWQFVHSIGRRNKRFYTLLPLIAAVPLGLIVGAVTSFMPLVVINYIVVIGLAVVFGESVYECRRLKGGGRPLEGSQKTQAKLFGAVAALVLAYFYTVGGFFTDMSRAGHGGDVSAVGYFLPWNVAWYLYIKLQYMVVAKFTQTGSASPSWFLNGLTIGLEYLFLIGVAVTVSGGGKREAETLED